MGGATLSATRLPWGRQPEFPSRWDNKDIQNPKSKYFVKLSEGQLRVTMKQTTKNLNKNIRVQEGCKDLAICGTTPYLPTPTPLSTPHRACIDSHQLCLFSRISVIQPQQTDWNKQWNKQTYKLRHKHQKKKEIRKRKENKQRSTLRHAAFFHDSRLQNVMLALWRVCAWRHFWVLEFWTIDL